MTDPFRALDFPEKRQRWIGAISLFVMLGLVALLGARSLRTDTNGILVEASVVGFGSYAQDWGDEPLVTVRLNDGSTRQLRVHREAIKNCAPGSRILLVQGSVMKVARQGCVSE